MSVKPTTIQAVVYFISGNIFIFLKIIMDCEGFEYPLIQLKAGLNLYHLTPIITQKILDEESDVGTSDELIRKYNNFLEIFENTPEDEIPYSDDLTSKKWFSINKYHPIYYGYNETSSVALNYVVDKDLILVDARGFETDFDEIYRIHQCIFNHPVLSACIDGWINRDDPKDPWLEILLLRPFEKISPDYFILNYGADDLERVQSLFDEFKMYPFEEDELREIREHTVAKGFLTVNGDDCNIVIKKVAQK